MDDREFGLHETVASKSNCRLINSPLVETKNITNGFQRKAFGPAVVYHLYSLNFVIKRSKGWWHNDAYFLAQLNYGSFFVAHVFKKMEEKRIAII